MAAVTSTARQKALSLNLDQRAYGTLAEIGAGQEVARWFFQAGGAAGTVAKSISAYDMAVSDALYGPAERYVSRQRLGAMLEHEFTQLVNGLGRLRGDTTNFFAFADTVAIRSYRHPENGRGWVGIRFQTRPREQASEIIIHVHLLDSSSTRQQEALGVLGVNLIYGASAHHREVPTLIGSLMGELSRERIEVDMIKLSGPAFGEVDHRLVSLQLVEQRLTDAAMFTAAGEVVQPSEVLHKRPVLVERGSFRPAARLTVDLLEHAREQFMLEPEVRGEQPVVLAEITRAIWSSPAALTIRTSWPGQISCAPWASTLSSPASSRITSWPNTWPPIRIRRSGSPWACPACERSPTRNTTPICLAASSSRSAVYSSVA